jgi:hypothetical protein
MILTCRKPTARECNVCSVFRNVHLPKKYEMARVMRAHSGSKYTLPYANGVAIS